MNQRGVSALWSLREDCVGIFVGQAPLIMPMLKRSFWNNPDYASSGSKTPNSFSISRGALRSPAQSHELRSIPRRTGLNDPYLITVAGGSESQEEIVGKEGGILTPLEPPSPGQKGILIQQSIEIRKSSGTYDDPRNPHW